MNPLNTIFGAVPRILHRFGVGSLKPLRPGETTRGQGQTQTSYFDYLSALMATGQIPVSEGEILPPTYATWRLMSRNPTLALAKAVSTAPILAANWSFQGRDKSVPDERVAFVREMLAPLREQYLEDACRAMEFGWAPFEVVWHLSAKPVPGLPSPRWEIRRFKPLLPEMTHPILAPISGQYLGIRNELVSLTPGKALVYTYDSIAGNIYGVPRHENVREEWCEYRTLRVQRRALLQKVSGVIPIIKYIRGKSIDPQSGNAVDNYTLAQRLLSSLATCRGVTLESAAFDPDDLRNNPELLKLSNFLIDTVDVGNAGQAIGPLIEQAEYLDSLLMRGWLQAERSALQGQHGTNAEAETHSKIGVVDSERVHRQMVRPVQQAVDLALELNFGPEARGSVIIEPSPLVDEKRAVLEQLYQAMLKNPGVFELLLSEIDRDQLYDRLELPKLESVAGADAGLPANPAGEAAVPPSATNAIGQTFTEADPSRPANPGTPAAPDTAKPEDVGLNGAQSNSAMDALLRIRTGELVPEAAIELLTVLGIDRSQAQVMVRAQSNAGPLPTPTVTPAGVPPTASPADQPPANVNPTQ